MSDPGEFLRAAQRGDAPEVERLVRADPGLVHATDDDQRTALHWAAEQDHVEVATALLNAGADIEARTSWGASPFDWAAVLGSSNVANLLLARGASGLTLITAASLGMIGEVRRIIESGEDLTRHRRRGAPQKPDRHWPADSAHIRGDVISDAFYGAGRNGHTDVAAYLLERGATIDAKGVFGGTALHWAAINGKQETVEFLVARGATLTLKDATFDATPEGWAREGGHDAIASFLRDAKT